MLCIFGFSAAISKISTLENKGLWYFLLTHQLFHIPTFNISQTVTPKPINHNIF